VGTDDESEIIGWSTDPDRLVKEFPDTNFIDFVEHRSLVRTEFGVRYTIWGDRYTGVVEATPRGETEWVCDAWVANPTVMMDSSTAMLALQVISKTEPPVFSTVVSSDDPKQRNMFYAIWDVPAADVHVVLDAFAGVLMKAFSTVATQSVLDRAAGLEFDRIFKPLSYARSIHGYNIRGTWHGYPVDFRYHRRIAMVKVGVNGDPFWCTIVPLSSPSVVFANEDDRNVVTDLVGDPFRTVLTEREFLAVFRTVTQYLYSGSPSYVYLLESSALDDSFLVTTSAPDYDAAYDTIMLPWGHVPVKLTYLRQQDYKVMPRNPPDFAITQRPRRELS